MKIQKIRAYLKDAKKEKNEVAELLSGFRKTQGFSDLESAIQLRMGEIDSFIQVVHAALEGSLQDESFYKENIGRISYLLEERFDELQIMIDALIKKKDAVGPALIHQVEAALLKDVSIKGVPGKAAHTKKQSKAA